MLDFLNIRLPEEAVTWIITMGEKQRVKSLETQLGRPRPAPVPFIRDGREGQWVSGLSDEQLAFIHDVVGVTLERCGYSLDVPRALTN
jgi:hypothetical protein